MDPINMYSAILPNALDSGSSTGGSNPPKVATGANLDMNSFLQLLATQFQNQDPTNPTDNTQFISELAQFTTLQAMDKLTQYADAQYGASLVGKTVIVASYDNNGNVVKDQGTVQSVSFSAVDGSTITVNGKAYTLGEVMQVINPTDSSSQTGGGDPTDGTTPPTDNTTPPTGNDSSSGGTTQT